MNILTCQQGDAAWHEARSRHYCASDASAAMGLSKYKTRAEFLRQRALGLTESIGAEKQALFDRGHAAEAAARPLVEAMLDDELYPCVGTAEVDGLPLLTSFDGLTIDGSIVWESKLYNEALAAEVQAGNLPDHYWPQVEHALLVSGARRAYFTVTDGTPERMVGLWYESQRDRRAALMTAWRQFDADVKAYVHTAVPDQVVAKEQPSLPVVIVKTEGQIAIRDNLPEFGVALKAYIAALPAKPTTDQEFADAEAACKTLKKAEDALAGEEERALASMSSVEALRNSIANLRAIARQARLATEKLVERRKTEVRGEIAQEFRAKLAEHVKGLNASLCSGLLVFPDADWGGAMKAKRTVQGLRDGCDDLLTKAKLAANDKAAAIRANLDTIDAAGRPHLFADRAQLVLKDHEAVTTIVAGRAQAEDERLERERQAAEQRERERIERAAKEAIEAATAEAKAAINRAESDAQAAMPAPVVERALQRIAPAAPLTTGSGVSTAVRTGPDEQPSLRMGVICERLGFIMNAQFIEDLGIKPAARDNRGLPLFQEAQFQAICGALVRHITNVAAESVVEA